MKHILVTNRFAWIECDEYQKDLIKQFKEKFKKLATDMVDTHYPKEQGYVSKAILSLEEASMWITKAISHNGSGKVIE